jgi:hypothetical protein
MIKYQSLASGHINSRRKSGFGGFNGAGNLTSVHQTGQHIKFSAVKSKAATIRVDNEGLSANSTAIREESVVGAAWSARSSLSSVGN